MKMPEYVAVKIMSNKKGTSYSLEVVADTDFVNVVRCKDCKFLSHFTDGHLECRLLHDLRPVPCTYVTMQENDFCSYGERREVQRNFNASNALDALKEG